MLLLLYCLKCEWSIGKGVFDISKVRQVGDYFFSTDLSVIELGSQGLALLVIGHLKHIRITSILAVEVNVRFSYIRQALVNKSTQFKCCKVFQSMVGRHSRLVRYFECCKFCLRNNVSWPSVISNWEGASILTDRAEKVSFIAHRHRSIASTGCA